MYIYNHCLLWNKLKFPKVFKRDSACDQFSKIHKRYSYENNDEENIFFYQQSSSQTDYWLENTTLSASYAY